MARINNTQTIKRIMDDGGIQTAIDDVPTQLASKVVPVLVSNPNRGENPLVLSADRSTTGAQTVLTGSTTKRFYLTSISLAYTCNATCDCVEYNTRIKPKGSSAFKEVINLLKETTTAGNGTHTRTFNPPIPLKKGETNVDFSQTFTAGTSKVSCSIAGFEVEGNNA